MTDVLHIGFNRGRSHGHSSSVQGTHMRKTTALEEKVLKRQRIEELGCPVEVRRHPGARRLTLRVSRTRRAVIVTLPVQCDLGEAGTFISRNIEWVRERLDSLPRPGAVPRRRAAAVCAASSIALSSPASARRAASCSARPP